jgi:SOS response regulatory protein OraA/RecX
MSTEAEIIAIVEIQRRGMLFLISFSEGSQIRATKGTIDRLDLSEESQFSRQTFAELWKILEEKFAHYTAESLLARRPYSVGEFKQRMRHKEIAENLITAIVKEFRNRGLLDDYKYSLMRIQSLIERKPAGRGYLVAWLQKRLVGREIAQKAVAEALAGTDEVDTAVELLKRRRLSFEKFDLETARRKAYTYLSHRAISYGAAKKAFEQVFETTTD